MPVSTDYVLKSPFIVNLSRAALISFRFIEFITFGGIIFQLGSILLQKKYVSLQRKMHNLTLKTLLIAAQIMYCFGKKIFLRSSESGMKGLLDLSQDRPLPDE